MVSWPARWHRSGGCIWAQQNPPAPSAGQGAVRLRWLSVPRLGGRESERSWVLEKRWPCPWSSSIGVPVSGRLGGRPGSSRPLRAAAALPPDRACPVGERALGCGRVNTATPAPRLILPDSLSGVRFSVLRGLAIDSTEDATESADVTGRPPTEAPGSSPSWPDCPLVEGFT